MFDIEKFTKTMWKRCSICGAQLNGRYHGAMNKNNEFLALCEKCKDTQEWKCMTVELNKDKNVNISPAENRITAIERVITAGKMGMYEILSYYGLTEKQFNKIKEEMKNPKAHTWKRW